MSITTHTSTIRQWVKNHTKDDIAIYFEDQFVKKEAAIDAAKNLLAVIHRDGGHHTDKVGFIQSCKDAEQVRHELFSALEGKDAEIERLKARNKFLEKGIRQLVRVVDMRYDGCFGVDATDPAMVWGMVWEDGHEVVWHDSECPELAAWLKEDKNGCHAQFRRESCKGDAGAVCICSRRRILETVR